MKIFYAGYSSENLLRLRNMAESLGIGTELVDVRATQPLPGVLKKVIMQGNGGLVLDVASLKDYASQQELQEAARVLGTRDVAALLFATDDQESTNQFLRIFTGGGVQKVQRTVCATSVRFPESGHAWSSELSSQTYPRQAKKTLTLTLAHAARTNVVMELDASPAFTYFRSEEARIFVWSTTEVFDVRRQLAAEKEFEVASDEYVPAIIFLRSAFHDQCWSNPSLGAGIIIDDPLLKKNYGFINFPQLLGSARKHGYHITLAFIPWNHWRSRSKEVQLFLDHSDCFSICHHGCDHTRNEYGFADYDALLRKNLVARERMERHGHRTGLPTEPLMVCPQEQYSLQAMRAFSDSRQFLALVNTACMPRNLRKSRLTAADLLLPAQDSFFGFPVFKRHYWNGMGVFAMALFLGKPAILVEHHEFFRNGSVGAEEFARRLAELRPDLKWNSLADTVTRTHARRRVSDDRWEVRFFTDVFQLEHKLEGSTEYYLFRRIPETTVVKSVLVDSKEVPFSRENGFLRFDTRASRPQTLSVQVEVAPVKPTKAYSTGVKYQASVALRRGLSELRDNIIVRNRFALKTSRLLMKSLKQTVR